MRDFGYLVRSALSATLLFANLLLPLTPIFAADEATAEANTPPVESPEPQVTSSESEEEVPPVEVVEPEPKEETIPDTPTDTPESGNEAAPDTAEEENVAEESAGDNEIPETSVPEASPSENAEPASEDALDSASSTDPLEGESSGEVEEVIDGMGSTSTPSTLPPVHTEPELAEISEEVQDGEETVIEEPEEEGKKAKDAPFVNLVTNDENIFSFGKSECVSVGGGAYYCSKAEEEAAPIGTDRMFSAPDEEGDREIYAEYGGEVVQLTDNDEDDDAPFYDSVSDSVVWHRSVDGRYQIVSYDVEDGEETMLTNDRYNNMEPSRYGDLTVWQGWIGNDWEIMLLHDDELMMLSDNTHHDIAPHINGTYVVWQSFENDAWRVKVYDTVTKRTETIDSSDGASVENPRFVLVYDSKQENGDVEVKGYDLSSKQVIPLDARPMPAPEDIPDPNETGEDQAMVSAASQLKPKNEGEENDLNGAIPNGDPEGDEPDLDDVVVPAVQSTSTDDGTLPVVSEIPDLVVAEGVTGTEHIEDLIVPPFVESDVSLSEVVSSD